MESLSSLLRLTGYQEDAAVISFQGMANLLVILMVISFIVVLVRLLVRVNQIAFPMKAVAIYIGTATVLQALLFAASGDTNATHWVSMVPFVFVTLGMAYETEEGIQKKIKRKIFWKGSFVLSVVLSSLSVWMTPRTEATANGDFYYQNQGMYEVAQWLTSQGYTKGIAAFWGSNVLTEYSDGAIEMWTIVTDSFEIYEWLQAKEHAERLPDICR